MQRRCFLGTAFVFALAAANPALAAPPRLAFSELYARIGVMGTSFSPQVLKLKGQRITMRGYIAPPLKAEANFFVLTRVPVSVCPFCNSDADWPADIVVVNLKNPGTLAPGGRPVEVTGMLDIGSSTDRETGFVSLVRLNQAEWREL
ncbi:hypothetical protein [Paludibacterium paludis]|uniref:DUF3299 domain-containing protein n=1 Tax=Paludibacterium paludis TaxID=1225769 RepID=A0A918P395_9NEIS|nr:hypothetical protein [Paludibacterium paludis]GGY17613.1 hypothetical protein GCM10011289_21370 [Paludibacterium paludis]